MKTQVLKNLIKQAVREAISEELKDIILEAIKQPLNIDRKPLKEMNSDFNNEDVQNIRKNYLQALNEVSQDMNPNNRKFEIPSNIDTVNGTLPEGDLDINIISSLINK
jgi:hypothetical protein